LKGSAERGKKTLKQGKIRDKMDTHGTFASVCQRMSFGESGERKKSTISRRMGKEWSEDGALYEGRRGEVAVVSEKVLRQ